MKLLFKQKFFSWFDSFDVFNEAGENVYSVKGQLSWGHHLKIYDENEKLIGSVREKVFSWYPKFEIFEGENYIGCICKEFSFIKPKFKVDFNGWNMSGNWLEHEYTIVNADENVIATVSKEVWNLTDTYAIDVVDPKDALYALMLVVAIDAEKASRNT